MHSNGERYLPVFTNKCIFFQLARKNKKYLLLFQGNDCSDGIITITSWFKEIVRSKQVNYRKTGMPNNILIVVEQAVNKCFDVDLTKFDALEIVVSANQKSLPIEFVRQLLNIQSQSGVPVELMMMKGSSPHHAELYLAWLLGRHTQRTPDANITLIVENFDATSLLENCVDEEFHDRIMVIQGEVDPAAIAAIEKSSAPSNLTDIKAPKKAPIELAAKAEAKPETKNADSKLISKLMERNMEARHPITGEPLPDPLNTK